MKKRLDTDRIANELKGSSLFFYPKPAAAEPDAPPVAAPAPHPETTEQTQKRAATPQRRNAVTPEMEDGEEALLGERFDINAPREAKGTFLLTQAEYDALSDLKRPLGRQYGTQVSLHDLARCGVNLLLEDLKRHGEQSFLHRHLQHKHQK